MARKFIRRKPPEPAGTNEAPEDAVLIGDNDWNLYQAVHTFGTGKMTIEIIDGVPQSVGTAMKGFSLDGSLSPQPWQRKE